MGLVDRLRDLFGNKSCEVCEAHRNAIQVMKDNQAFLQSEIVELRLALMKATRLVPITERANVTGPAPNPIQTQPSSWRGVQRELEKKYKNKPKSPEDIVEETWLKKASDLEKQAGM